MFSLYLETSRNAKAKVRQHQNCGLDPSPRKTAWRRIYKGGNGGEELLWGHFAIVQG